MSERYWKEREGDEFFDDYIDVTDEVAALREQIRRMVTVNDALRAGRDAETRRADDNYDAMKRAEAERDKAREEKRVLFEHVKELVIERDAMRNLWTAAREWRDNFPGRTRWDNGCEADLQVAVDALRETIKKEATDALRVGQDERVDRMMEAD